MTSRPQRPRALVTGAGRGIGLAIAEALAPAHRLVLVGRNPNSLSRAAERLHPIAGEPVHTIAADLALEADRERLLAELGTGEPVTVVVNNAGIAPSATLARTDDAQWDATIALNLTVPFILTRALVPAMITIGWGRVINIASTAAIKGYRYTCAYSASKAGLLGMTRALAVELAAKGITVNAVCPGFTDTDLISAALGQIERASGRSPEDARRTLESFSPQRRLLRPDEVAELVRYLASDAAQGINGQALAIDGGETA